jgi:transmembrane sensor
MNISEQQFQELLDRYLKGKASTEEIKLLDQFFNSYGDKKDIPVWRETESKEEVLQNLHDKIHKKHSANLLSINLWMPVAAALALIIVTFYFLIRRDIIDLDLSAETITESTARGEKLTTYLPDGTKVFLNADSRITYTKDFGSDLREVTLNGEAFFEVVHNAEKPFVVHTEQASTRVLGTSFNVKNISDQRLEVTLVEGKVNVISSRGESAVLKPNQQAIIESQSALITTKEVETDRFVDWKNNTLRFEQVTLQEAVNTLQTWYDVTITVQNPSLAKCMITATYQDESLENVLKSFEFLLKIKYTINDKQVVIDGKACN